MQKMAGPFIPLPGEVIELLAAKGGVSLTYYVLLLNRCFTEIKENTHTDWVGVYVHHTERQIRSILGASGYLADQLFPQWEELGLLDRSDGKFFLPKYYKKGDAYLQPLRLQSEMHKLREASGKMQKRQVEMEETIEQLLNLLSGQREDNTIPVPGHRADLPGDRADLPGDRSATSLLMFKDQKIPLTVMNKIISIFYRGIDQKKISGKVRGASQKTFRNLLKDGFSPYEIAFAVDWTVDPKNMTEKLRSFGVISSTIGRAIEVMQKKMAVQEQATEQAAEERTKDVQRATEAADRERLVELKEQMSPVERQELKETALIQLREKGLYQENMITDVLISIQENDILRKSEQEQTDSGE